MTDKLITRAEYMADSKALHHAYFLQFATRATFDLVRRRIGVDAIRASTDPHLNDIPLRRWDELPIQYTINTSAKGAAEGFPPGRYGWCQSDSTCIAKAVARELAKEAL